MQSIDSLICAQYVIPSFQPYQPLTEHAVAFDQGKIVDILPKEEAQRRYAATHIYNLNDHLIMPGLINCHNHAAMSLFRGLADDLALMDWLQNHIWPAEAQWVSPSFVKDGITLAAAEMIRGGTTCFADMYFFPETAGKTIADIGMRAAMGLTVIDFPTAWADNADEYIEKGMSVFETFRDHPLITTMWAPHAPYTVSDEPLKKLASLAEQLDIPIQMHIHETADEVEQAVDKNGLRPLHRLENLGLLSPRLQAVHMTQLNDEDIDRVKRNGVHVIHCPQSNMKLASGICPVTQLLANDVNVALGTDGAASNNDLDMFTELQTAALLAKVGSMDARSFPALDVMHAATLGGAKTLGLDSQIGTLEKGKYADMIAINMNQLTTSPCYNLASHLVYATNSQQVEYLWVGGKPLLAAGKLMSIDTDALKIRNSRWQEKIIQKGQ
ncbi:MAG: TRZ/ATZ family hydrolase [Pseudomonadota bacterium]